MTAFATAAVLVTLAVFLLRLLLPHRVPVPAGVLALIFVVLAACDLRLGPLRTPGWPRQTCAAWRRRFGVGLATVFWGLDIGSTVSTIKATSLYWASIVVLLTLAPPRPELAVACFAAGYLLSHLVSVRRVRRGLSLSAAVARANSQVARARITSGVLLAGLGGLIFVQAVISWLG